MRYCNHHSTPMADFIIAGYYVIVVVLLIITILVSMHHKQIVTWLTPFTKWVHECVLFLVYCNTVTLTHLQFGIRVACPDCRFICDILSSSNVLFYCPSSHCSLVRFSYLVTKSSPFFVGWYGAYGVGLESLLSALSSARLAISSALIQLRSYSAY